MPETKAETFDKNIRAGFDRLRGLVICAEEFRNFHVGLSEEIGLHAQKVRLACVSSVPQL